MNLSRELDVLIAEKIFGWQRLPNFIPARWSVPGAPPQSNTPSIEDIPNYSTDICAAWKIVDKIKLLKFAFLGQTINGDWGVWSNDEEWEEFGRTAPHAMCLAALKVMENK